MTTTQDPRTNKRATWIRCSFLFLAALYLYINLFTISHIPIFLSGDQTFFWVYAQRLLQGEQIYRNFFQFTPPGTDLVYAAIFHLLGTQIWVTNLIVLLLGVLLCNLCFDLAIRLVKPSSALLTSGIFLILIYGSVIDATHHWFSVLASLCAVRVIMPARTPRRIVFAGILLGIASFFTQTDGAAAGVAVALSLACEQAWTKKPWRFRLRQEAILFAAAAATWSILSLYWIARIGWQRLWYFQITYPARYVNAGQITIHGATSNLSDLTQQFFVYAVIFLIYPWSLWICWQRRREKSNQETIQILLLALTGVFLLLAVITRVNWHRLYIVSMPAFILLSWRLDRLGKLKSYVTTALWILILILAARRTISRQRHADITVDLPAGRTALSSLNAERYIWLRQHTTPGDFLLQAQNLDLYTTLQVRNPISADGLWPYQSTRPEYVELALQQVEQHHVKYIIWSPWLAQAKDHKESQNPLNPFRTYLLANYTRVHVFSNTEEVWQRR